MNYSFAFVVLHYMTFKDTEECVNSILENVGYKNYLIVIVDNGSTNGSGKALERKYSDNAKIKLLFNKKNLGFAKGNNVGFRYAKYKLKSDFIVMINNDTIIKQDKFLENIIEEYNYEKFHILGPDILSTKDGIHQNPRRITLQNEKELRFLVKFYRIKIFLNFFLLDDVLEKAKKRIFKTTWVKTGDNVTPTWKEKKENAKLHGSALIFSPDFISNYEGLNPDTFMHSEEAILYFIVKRDNLRTIYTPAVKILHKEDSSTDSIYKKSFKKRRFYYKNFIRSGKVLLKLMEKERNKQL